MVARKHALQTREAHLEMAIWGLSCVGQKEAQPLSIGTRTWR